MLTVLLNIGAVVWWVSSRLIRCLDVLRRQEVISVSVYGSAHCRSLSDWPGQSDVGIQIWALSCLVLSAAALEWAGLLIWVFSLRLGGMASPFLNPSLCLTCCVTLFSAPWRGQCVLHLYWVCLEGNCGNRHSSLDSDSWKVDAHTRGVDWRKWTLDEANNL